MIKFYKNPKIIFYLFIIFFLCFIFKFSSYSPAPIGNGDKFLSKEISDIDFSIEDNESKYHVDTNNDSISLMQMAISKSEKFFGDNINYVSGDALEYMAEKHHEDNMKVSSCVSEFSKERNNIISLDTYNFVSEKCYSYNAQYVKDCSEKIDFFACRLTNQKLNIEFIR